MARVDALAVALIAQHTSSTCGQSRKGGLITSKRTRRSNVFGRVAVTHVQGSPKGGGALCVRRVINTRLAPVPPSGEVPMSEADTFTGIGNTDGEQSTVPHVWSLVTHDAAGRVGRFRPRGAGAGFVGLKLLLALTVAGGPTAVQAQERQELLARIQRDIDVAPDRACAWPQRPIEERLSTELSNSGFMENIALTVFGEDAQTRAAPSGMDALMQRTREETAALAARNKAIYAGEQVPVGDQAVVEVPKFEVDLFETRAIERFNGGLWCTANARASHLRFPVTWSVFLNPEDADGWSADLRGTGFSEAEALADNSPIRVRYGDRELSLAQARQQARDDERRETLAAETAERQRAEIARNSVRCVSLDRQVQQLMRKEGIEVFEITNTRETFTELGTDCYGQAYTSRGRLTIAYGITRTPQGRQIVEARVISW